MVAYFFGMLSVGSPNDSTGDILLHLFMNAVSDYKNGLGEHSGRDNPIWIQQYNYQSILNYPEQIRMLGPIRNRWEGGIPGEGYLRFVKPLVQAGRMNWDKNIMCNLLRKKSLSNIQWTLNRATPESYDDDDSDEDSSNIQQQLEPQSYIKYKTFTDVCHLLEEKKHYPV
jgi:hypothetical protein